MSPLDGTYHNDKYSKESPGCPSDSQNTTHEPSALHDTNNVGVAQEIQARATEISGNPPLDPSLNEPRGPAPPPKDLKSTTHPASAKNAFNKMKKTFKARERERERQGSKDAHYAPNELERIRDQDRQIKILEKAVSERDIHIRDLEELIQQYRSRLQEGEMLKQELLSIRQNLRLDDEDEPWVIVKSFEEINKKVDDISVKFRSRLCDANARRELNTSDLVEKLIVHQGYEGTVSAKAVCPIGSDEFIELGCRAMLNGLLADTVLERRMMNPSWDKSTNEICYKMLKSVQANEAQVNAGRWRISTFKTIRDDAQDYCELQAKLFCDNVLVPFCKTAYRTEACITAIRSMVPDIITLLNQAYSWNHRTRSTVLMLDFQVVYYPPGSQFNSFSAKLDESEAKLGIPETIFLTSELGLLSYKVVGDGNQQRVCQAKALVLGENYFRT
ncbi:unnamed protein product [Rhizoctonia solani]|uniref:Uncharacterized protein n=1 Tax=Rhizoctonia solani TaxID=456999 RepID=A0A8H3B1P5_9AGAM|nr:unnamed protein product [Rhizoctonia solani]